MAQGSINPNEVADQMGDKPDSAEQKGEELSALGDGDKADASVDSIRSELSSAKNDMCNKAKGGMGDYMKKK